MHGEGKMSADGKTLTINYTYNCPITKKKGVFREVLRFDSSNKMHVEMFMKDPKSGKEYDLHDGGAHEEDLVRLRASIEAESMEKTTPGVRLA
jgi:hypothetical protein